MVGYGDNMKGYRILLPDGHIVVSRDVRFDEHMGAAAQDRGQPTPPSAPTPVPAVMPGVRSHAIDVTLDDDIIDVPAIIVPTDDGTAAEDSALQP